MEAMNQANVMPDLKQAVERHHAAINRFINGDAALLLSACSKKDDICVAGAWGAYDRGWEQVSCRLDWACKRFVGNENHCEFENVTLVASGDLACSVDLEYNTVRLQGGSGLVSMVLRVTTLFRREDGDWKMVLRHGDPLTSEKPVESVVRQ
jgi:ketosteroid isomerase-like protein